MTTKKAKLSTALTLLAVAGATPAAEQSYGGDLMTRSTLTGDWGGWRDDLSKKGVTLDVDLVQTGQGVPTGGRNSAWEYNGEALYDFNVDFGKLGLWPGGFLKIFAESQFGPGVNLNTGAIAAVNTNALFPVPNDEITTLSSVQFTQFFTDWFGVFGGKLVTITDTQGDTNEFAGGRGQTQFMNQNLAFNPVMLQTIPYSTLGGGLVFLLPQQRGSVTFSVLGPSGTAEKFGDAFDDGQAYAMETRIKTDFFGLPGHQLLGATGSTKDFTSLNQDPRLFLAQIVAPGLFPVGQQGGSWSVYYNFDQYVYTEPGPEDRGVGLFGRLGFADDETNPVERFYSIGVGGKGVIPGRGRDSFGAAFYYVERTDQLQSILRSWLDDSYGGEIYYNFELTPWLHFTPDLQVFSPSLDLVDTTVVTGLRLMATF